MTKAGLKRECVTFLKNSDTEPFLSVPPAAGLAGFASLLAADWTARVPLRVCADSGCSVAPPPPVTLTWTGKKVMPPVSLAIPAEVRGQRSVTRLHRSVCKLVGTSPCTGMVTVCPLLAVTVAVAMETTVCPAAIAATRPALVMAVGAVPVAVRGSLSTESIKRRRRNGPVGGELYRSNKVGGEGDTAEGSGPRLTVVWGTPLLSSLCSKY